MSDIEQLFANNKAWADGIKAENPDFFARLAEGQSPEYLWIGCSDSRMPANQLVGMDPGSIFVHRNIANVVPPSDINCLSVIQYAVEALKVKHIMVVGHYGCGGVCASMEDQNLGLIDNWLNHIRTVQSRHEQELNACATLEQKQDLMCELNVKAQVEHVCQTNTVREAWARGQELTVHGWIYRLKDGVVNDLDVSVSGN
ncbi:MAG: carbonate dehydratase [Candidatus Pelagadaptatus aseana]|uniref:carbonate dehydratase n=1 Tax=Candidatus Pelagadaptatus aseana TaxID=3120508 RepID=UPI0039B29536